MKESDYNFIKETLLNLEFDITIDKKEDGILVIQKEEYGVKNLFLVIADPILIIEQFIFKINQESADIYKCLLQKNRDIIHGAFVLDETGDKVIFRDTLQLKNLDSNELEASLNSLSLLMSEFSEQIIQFSKF